MTPLRKRTIRELELRRKAPGTVSSYIKAVEELAGRKRLPVGKNFLFPVRALSKVFRAKYIERLQQLLDKNELDLPPRPSQLMMRDGRRRWMRLVRRKAWVVYSKAPFTGPQKLLDYPGRYTHRIVGRVTVHSLG